MYTFAFVQNPHTRNIKLSLTIGVRASGPITAKLTIMPVLVEFTEAV
jgi:hypothetical protein